MVFIHHLLGRNALFLGPNGDGHAVLVGTANKFYIAADRAQVAHVNVGGQINPGQMPNVYRPVGIGQSSGNRISFRKK